MPHNINPQPVRVLVLDDDPAIVRIVVATLNGAFPAAITTQIAFDGDQAEAMMKVSSFDLIITDLDMPTTSGFQILKLAKQNNVLTQVVILSGLSDASTLRSAFKLGADEYLFKPILPVQMIQTIKYFIERAARFRYVSQMADTQPTVECPIPENTTANMPSISAVE